MVCLSVCLSVCLPVCLPACLSVCLSVCPLVNGIYLLCQHSVTFSNLSPVTCIQVFDYLPATGDTSWRLIDVPCPNKHQSLTCEQHIQHGDNEDGTDETINIYLIETVVWSRSISDVISTSDRSSVISDPGSWIPDAKSQIPAGKASRRMLGFVSRLINIVPQRVNNWIIWKSKLIPKGQIASSH